SQTLQPQQYQQQQYQPHIQPTVTQNSYSQLPAHLNQQFSMNGSTAVASIATPTHQPVPVQAIAAKPARQSATRGRGAKTATRKQSARATAAQQNRAALAAAIYHSDEEPSGSGSGSSSSGESGSGSGSESESEESDM